MTTRPQVLVDMDAYEVSYAQDDYRGDHGGDSDYLMVRSFGDTPVIFTAPHATKQLRDGVVKEEDQATGGLAEALASQLEATCLTITNQAGDPNTDPKAHPFKVKIGDLAVDRGIQVLFDLHGIGPGTVEKTGAHIGVGLGPNPSAASGFIAQALKARGKQLGIEVRTGNSAFSALGTNTVTATATRYGLIAVQLELAPFLRFGEGNDETRLAAFNLIAGVAQDVVAAFDQLDTLAYQAKTIDRSKGAPVFDVAAMVMEALAHDVPRKYIEQAILARASFDHTSLEMIFHEDLYSQELGEAGEIMREWASAHIHVPA